MDIKIIRRHKDDGVTIIDCHGPITLGSSADPLREAIREETRRGARLIVNFADVPYVNPAAVADLVSRFTTVKVIGGWIALLHVTPHVQEAFGRTALETIAAFDNEGAAVRYLVEASTRRRAA